MPAAAAEALVMSAQRKGDLIAVRMSVIDDEAEPDPWTLPPSRKRLERPIEGPLPESVQVESIQVRSFEPSIKRGECGETVSRRR
jgi:hypothetical protein